MSLSDKDATTLNRDVPRLLGKMRSHGHSRRAIGLENLVFFVDGPLAFRPLRERAKKPIRRSAASAMCHYAPVVFY